MGATLEFLVRRGTRSLQGRLRVPGDKSISHRVAMLGSIAEGSTRASGFLQGADCRATLDAFRAMGVGIEGPEAGEVVIHGVGLQGLSAPAAPLYLGNAGTSMRLLAGLLAGQRFESVLSGDSSLSGRPMRRVTEPLRRMGARIETSPKGTPPLRIRPAGSLQGIDYPMPVASAQVKSCLLLAGLYASGRTCVSEPAPTRDHTERMLAGLGHAPQSQGARVCVVPAKRLQGALIDVPADISSAAFFMVGASIAQSSDLLLEHVGVNPTRTGIIPILRAMGADITLLYTRTISGEPVADIRVRYAGLRGIEIPRDTVPLAIDEFPAIFIAAACARGTTVLSGAQELRVKESDRIQVMADGLQACGVQVQTAPDGISVQGGQLRGGTVDSHGDHRIAMAFAMAALAAQGSIRVRDCANVDTSFPGFVEAARSVGLDLKLETG
jgi:3-phosphoshikimate 1-carboxyvinyltransferase